ncbi:VENN motif pre-toxin domain-containing protein, partial [Rhodospirillum sp. A1_3_36]|uniref:VENN motif pre-toxin domain-containing protein n=1 Tax=Rhodospirillum sp. A1_3_36 TaxID=3391666 RepID=UPI0039A6D29E
LTDAALSGLDLPGLNVAASELTFVERLERVALQATIRNTIQFGSNVALYGQDPGDAAVSLARNLGADVVGAMVAYEIGQAYTDVKDTTLGYIGHKVAHAALGCATGAIAGTSCSSRAVGAAVAEMAAEAMLGNLNPADYTVAELGALKERLKGFSKMTAATAAALAGLDANEAADAADVAVENNWGETPWDLFSLAVSLEEYGIVFNDENSTLVDRLLAGAAVVFDGAMVAVPGLFGGAGVILKAERVGKNVVVRATAEVGESGAKVAVDAKTGLRTEFYNAAGQATKMRDPLTNQVIDIPSGVSIHKDHIFPKDAIKDLPGFKDLNKVQRKLVENNPINYQPLPASLNCSKGCRVQGTETPWITYKGTPIDAGYSTWLRDEQNQMEKLLVEQINGMKG